MDELGFDGDIEIVVDSRGEQTIVEVDRDGDRWALLFDETGELAERTPAPPVSTPPWLGPAIKKAAPQLRVA
ncbi:hypothetical protein JCM31271_23740 [Halorubrum trueperi]